MEASLKRHRSDARPSSLNRGSSTKRQRTLLGEIGGNLKLKSTEPAALICDSGAYGIKVGHGNLPEPIVVPNCIMKAKSERKRLFVGDQIEDCRDLSGLYYLLPCERGYVTKWDVQKPVWDYVFRKHPLDDRPLLMTQPLFNFKSIQECMDEIFFEEYEVKSMLRTCPTDLARFQYIYERGRDVSCIIIDSGYSYTHIVPYIKGKKYYPGVKRIFVGGKLLTNYLKDILSYRKLHVMEETYVINQVKEDICFVSRSLKDDMRMAKIGGTENSILRDYILPDFNNIRRGYVRNPDDKEFPENCQILHLNNERFTVPELLMRPSNIGIQSMGIPEAVAKCVEQCPVEERQALMNNIVLVGGNSKFPGYEQRLYDDIRSLTPCHLSLKVYAPENPIFYAWQGGRTLSRSRGFHGMLVTKHDYEEYGSKLTYKKFSDWLTAKVPEPKIEVKPKKVSILENLKGVDLFGKGGDELEEVRSVVDRKVQIEIPELRAPAQPKLEPMEKSIVVPQEVKIKNNLIPITTIRLPQLSTATLKPSVISTLRFIPIGEVLKNSTILSNVTIK